ncbi:hypothetical protein EJ03DRAFT_355669 [Teratosphaeria nubilosa]|uniref:Uncharacterized protein n=1 Tax=Teratosphaeria nubilosa TaxID=161662 RepID=A0A6G1KW35_9PEZI|nr:hypothetical protein EJ03DRAFT_355669 [Teratosphaeria nubilosa]
MNLLIRDRETLTVSISGEGKVDGQEASQITIVAINPTQDAQQANPGAQEKTKVGVQAHRSDDASRESGLPAAEHASYITTMLACCYQAQTEDILEKYVNVLCTYVFTVNHNKMLRRFQSGTASKGRKFLTYLTTELSDIVNTKWGEDLPVEHSSCPPKQNELRDKQDQGPDDDESDTGLELICLHATSIDIEKGRVRPGQPQSAAAKRESELVTKPAFTVVDIQQDELSAATPDDDIDIDAVKKLFGNSGKIDDWEKIHFTGSVHCEAILLGLTSIANNTDDPSKQWLESNGIFNRDTNLIQRFRNLVPLIPASKRCCPTCSQLRHLMAEAQLLQGAKKPIVPGQYKTWSPTALPPFTPKAIAEKCLQFVRTSAIERLRELQTIADADELSGTCHSDPADPRDENAIMANSDSLPEDLPAA